MEKIIFNNKENYTLWDFLFQLGKVLATCAIVILFSSLWHIHNVIILLLIFSIVDTVIMTQFPSIKNKNNDIIPDIICTVFLVIIFHIHTILGIVLISTFIVLLRNNLLKAMPKNKAGLRK